MNLDILPTPKSYEFNEGNFTFDNHSKIILNSTTSFENMQSTLFFKKRFEEELLLTIDVLRGVSERYTGIHLIRKDKLSKEAYELEVNKNGIYIYSNTSKGFHYGMMTVLQLIKEYGVTLPCLTIYDEPHFKHRGFYQDVTRGKVPKKETLFELIDLLSEYKVNELQLYIEHTFLWEGFSEVFRDKDAYSPQDILEIDAYAHERHIELIPSIATFGHMYEILKTQTFEHLSEKEINFDKPFSFVNRMAHHTINVEEEESLKLVKHMIEEFIPLFRSNKFNICGDETFDLGQYRTKELAEEVGVGQLYVGFLNKIIEIVQSNNREVLFWGDIIVKYPELLDQIPDDVTCLNWGYMANQPETNTKIISESKVPQYVCPSTTGWNRMINWLDNSSKNIRTMVGQAVKYDAYGILNTDWGDHGHVNLLSSSIPMIVYGAALSWNPFDAQDDVKDDKIISRSYYGKENEGLLDLLRRISRNQIAHWSFINFHLEREYANQTVIDPYEDVIKELDTEEIYKSYFELKHLKKELLEYSKTLDSEYRQDFNEFLVMTDLMSLTQEAFLYIMKFDLEVEVYQLTRAPQLIAEDIEYSVENYKNVWRVRNRESELFRVTQKFYEIADLLRRHKKVIEGS